MDWFWWLWVAWMLWMWFGPIDLSGRKRRRRKAVEESKPDYAKIARLERELGIGKDDRPRT